MQKKEENTNADGRSKQELLISNIFLEGKRAVYQGDYPKAVEYFKRCVKEEPEHHAAMYELSRLYFLKQDWNSSLEWAEKAYKLDSENLWYLRQVINVQKQLKDYTAAAANLRILIEKEAHLKQNYYDLANVYIFQENYSEALKVYLEIEKRFGFETGVVLQRKQIYLKQGDYSAAEKEVDLLIEHFPGEKNYYGMKSDILLSQGKAEKALVVLNKILELDPNDGMVHLNFADYYRITGEPEKVLQEEILAFANPNLAIGPKVKVTLRYFNQKSQDPVIEQHLDTLTRLLCKTHPNEDKAYALRGDYFSKRKEFEKAYPLYLKVLELDPSRFVVWEQSILILYGLERYKEMEKQCREALKVFPTHSSLYYYDALAAYENKHFKRAVEQCEMGLNFTYKPAQQEDFYLLAARASVENLDFNMAYENFESLLFLKSNHPEGLREYALALAKQNKDLSKAEQMIKTSLELDPGSLKSYYTYAFVLYRQGQYDQALHWLNKAQKMEEQDAFAVLQGDIYAAKGDFDKAKEWYQKALELGADASKIEHKLKKIKF